MSRAVAGIALVAAAVAPVVAQPLGDDRAPIVTRSELAPTVLPALRPPGVAPPEPSAPEPAAVLAPSAVAPPPRLAISGYVQVDAVPWSQASLDELDPATGEPLNQTRVLVRRARLRADYRDGGVEAGLELDGNTVAGATARLLAAHVRHKRPVGPDAWFDATAGLFKIPFGGEVPESERDRLFLEPSTAARALFPGNHDAGVMVRAAWRHARLAVAATNGAPVGDAQFAGRDPSAGIDLVARAGVDVEIGDAAIVAGASIMTGSGLHAGTPPTKDQIQWVDGNEDGIVQTVELQVIAGRPALPAETFERSALGVDLRVTWSAPRLGRGHALVEGVIATNLDRGLFPADPVAATRDLRELGWQVGAVQAVGPRVELGVRYDRYQPDRDASEVRGDGLVPIAAAVSTLSVVAAARHGRGRVVAGFDHERNPFGRRDDGAPTTRAADRVTVRAQVVF